MNLLFANDHAGHYPASWYAATAVSAPEHPSLKGKQRADVCIIGGGYTGLSAALHLARAGLDVVLLEAHRLGFGASGRNGGQVGSGQRLEQDALEKMAGLDTARKLWSLAEDAKALVRGLIEGREGNAPMAGVTWKPGIAHACWQDAEVTHAHRNAEKLARDYGYTQVTPLDRQALAAIVKSDAYKGGDLDMGAGHIHPLNFALGLAAAAHAAGARLHEGTLVHEISHGSTPGAKVTVRSNHGQVEADHLILACNGYLGRLDLKVAARVMPINNFILATEPLGDRAKQILSRDVAVADSKFVVNYFRLSDDGRLLFGGGESYGYRFPRDLVATVRKPMLQVFPQLADARIDHAWGGTLAITMTRMPCFTRPRPNVLSASGYSGHGVAMATLAGKIMAEAVQGQAARFDVMSGLPTRAFPGGGAFRSPLLALAMTWYSMRDRLGV